MHPSPQRVPEPAPANATSPVGEINGRVNQLTLVQHTLQYGANPTMIAGIAMIIVQMQSQAAYPDVQLTLTSSIGSLERSASFFDGTWHGYDLTHHLIDLIKHTESLLGLPWTNNGRLGCPQQPCNQ